MSARLQLDYRDSGTVTAYDPDSGSLLTVGYRRADVYVCAGCNAMHGSLPALDEHVQGCPEIRPQTP
ncbi:hypothetical protein DMB42_11715 [Nonomuraea sp. WAC 01424]|uniref:hypothetical protein n=1 Tax=Nonomuraea sp. WAC 01424 TaxID=2203200 RepID=UPI000F783F07|nr:hypothetical protein [Nonomuraea sp. WAC 01424]RSN12838.1 hypothetical protein DMB42_11715 [Nonomuraea sp. WAC 01424]